RRTRWPSAGADPGAEPVELVIGPADEPGQILDERGIPVERVGDVHAGPAVQVVAGAQRTRRLVGEPVRGHVEVTTGLYQLTLAGAACVADGALAGALALTTAHVGSRKQFGRPH